MMQMMKAGKVKMKSRKVWKWMNRIITSVLMVLLVGVAAIVLSTKLASGEPEVFGHQMKTVLSGSMEPGIQTGSIIAVKPVSDGNNLKKNDVITFKEDAETLITHRIIEVTETKNGSLYTTKGDNNDGPDREQVLADNVIGVYSGLTIPYVGYMVHFSQSPEGSALLLIVPGIFLLGYSVITIWKALRQLDVKDDKPADVK